MSTQSVGAPRALLIRLWALPYAVLAGTARIALAVIDTVGEAQDLARDAQRRCHASNWQ
jgi:hypothetical protein